MKFTSTNTKKVEPLATVSVDTPPPYNANGIPIVCETKKCYTKDCRKAKICCGSFCCFLAVAIIIVLAVFVGILAAKHKREEVWWGWPAEDFEEPFVNYDQQLNFYPFSPESTSYKVDAMADFTQGLFAIKDKNNKKCYIMDIKAINNKDKPSFCGVKDYDNNESFRRESVHKDGEMSDSSREMPMQEKDHMYESREEDSSEEHHWPQPGGMQRRSINDYNGCCIKDAHRVYGNITAGQENEIVMVSFDKIPTEISSFASGEAINYFCEGYHASWLMINKAYANPQKRAKKSRNDQMKSIVIQTWELEDFIK